MAEQSTTPNNAPIQIGRYRRTPHCWVCWTDLDNAIDEECAFCGWIICPQCGACDPNCTFSHMTGRDADLRRIVRDYLLATPDADEAQLENFIIEQKSILEEKREQEKLEEEKREKERLAALAKELEEKIKTNMIVRNQRYGVGVITKIYSDDGHQKIKVQFGKDVKRLSFPETFDSGRTEFYDINSVM